MCRMLPADMLDVPSCQRTGGCNKTYGIHKHQPDAAYWQTMFRDPPWSYEPAYVGLAGFKLQYIHPDLLHVWHLGTGRDFAASVIVYIVRHKVECPGVFAGSNMTDRLADATSQLKAFARSHKLPLKLHKLSKEQTCYEIEIVLS